MNSNIIAIASFVSALKVRKCKVQKGTTFSHICLQIQCF